MDAKLTFKYDRAADILYINTRPPYAGQESEELGDEVIDGTVASRLATARRRLAG